MKKYIPYIFITAFIGAFLTLSFAGSFSGNILGPKIAEAQAPTVTGDQAGPTVANDTSTTEPWYKTTGRWAGYAIGYGTYWGKGSLTDNPIGHIISMILELFFYMTSKLLALSAILLDTVIQFTVTNFKTNIEGMGVIDTGYAIILNLANMIFIFILLYIAINMILGIGSGDIKKLLTRVIVVALMINFSLFMTKVIIDASNIVSIGFLNAIKTPTATVNGKSVVEQGSVATSWMSGLKLQTVAYNPNSEVVKIKEDKGLNYYDISMNYIGGSALNLVTAFVFFAASFLFITRFIALLFYMIFSPVAFLGIISPELKKYSSKWWEGLQNQVIFAPAFLMIAYLVSAIINSGKLMQLVPSNQNATFYNVIQSNFTIGFPIVMNYVILIALMIGGLIAAKAMAAQGSGGIVAYADKVRGWAQGAVGRNTIGRGAYLANENNLMRKFEAWSPMLGGLVRKPLENVAGASFGGEKGGYKKALDEKIKQQVARSKNLTYEGKEVKRMEKEIKEEENKQEQRTDARFNLKQTTKEAKKTYENKSEENEKELKDLKLKVETFEKELKVYGEYEKPEDKVEHEKAKERIEEINLETEKVKSAYTKAQDEYEKVDDEIYRSDKKIKDTKKSLEVIQNKYKKEYTEKLPWAHFGRGWGALDKIFPSYTKAVKEIKKGKKTVRELLDEARKETGEKKEGEDKKKEEEKA